MKNDLTCAVVRDLLPPYVEGLTEEETNEAVERHLAECPRCRGRRDAMGADAETQAAEEKELDYLKTVNKKSRRRVVKAVAVTVLLVVLGILLKLFVIGEPASAAGMSWSMQQDGNYMNVRAFTTWSGVAYCRWETEREGDSVYIRTKKVLPSYLYPTADNRMMIPLEGVNHIYLAERLIWSEGEAITERVLDLMAHKVEYLGDAPAIIDLGLCLGFDELGDYTNGLRTATEPYRWYVEFTSGDKDIISDHMMVNSLYMLALVENLEQVSWMAPYAAEQM
ncbi:MAG: zf-HC2 domain-containing protein, partial [Oscillibacter sp.]|nr:zf-HC2 domain-containing protein [Oscillibacter sp.]